MIDKHVVPKKTKINESKQKMSKFKKKGETPKTLTTMTNKLFLKNSYDIIVVGGGISGLNTAYYLKKKYPKLKILLLEAGEKLGGRLQTIQYHGTQYEAGGARFSNNHKRLIHLLKHLGLYNKKIPISSDTHSRLFPLNKYNDISYLDKLINNGVINLDPLFKEISNLKQSGRISHKELVNHSVLDLVDKKLDHKYKDIKKVLEHVYEYWSELAVMNSNDALMLFKNDFNKKMQFYLLSSGLSSIIKKLDKQFNKLGGKHKTLSYLDSINYNNNKYELSILENYSNPIKYYCNHLVLAIQQKDLLKLNYLTKNNKILKMLKSVSPQPLYRVYAKYPVTNGKVWFQNIPKIATNLHLKFIIPYDYSKGLIMIIYADGKYAKYWNNKLGEGDEMFRKQLNLELSQLFPDLKIPDPIWIKHHYWNSGAAYWKTGIESHQIIPKMIAPYGKEQNIYVCGENFSNHQAWMEGALQTSELVIDEVSDRLKKENFKLQGGASKHKLKHGKKQGKKHSKSKKTKKVKYYTMDEVSKHDKKSDAWLVIRRKVYNVTPWIDKHPGGLIIMKGVGKDATSLFNKIGHSQNAKKILKTFFIGNLK